MRSDAVNDHHLDHGTFRSRGIPDPALAVLGLKRDQDAVERGTLDLTGAGVDLGIALHLGEDRAPQSLPEACTAREYKRSRPDNGQWVLEPVPRT